jgi:hypothetical protein
MIAPQVSSMNANPLLSRNIEDTVNNLKNLEICIDQLRNDLIHVAESTGNIPAAHRLRIPAHFGVGQSAFGGSTPWDLQRQLANPFAQGAVSPFEPYAASAISPYAQQSAFSPYAASAISPYAQQSAFSSPYAQQVGISPYAQQSAFSSPYAQQVGISPYAASTVSPFASTASPWAQHAGISPYAASTVSPFASTASPWAQHAGISPYAASTVSPWAMSGLTNPAVAAQALYGQVPSAFGSVAPHLTQLARQAAFNPWQANLSQAWSSPSIASRVAQTPLAAQSQFASTQSPLTQDLAARQFATQIPQTGTVGPF